jgi:hypothetical protein
MRKSHLLLTGLLALALTLTTEPAAGALTQSQIDKGAQKAARGLKGPVKKLASDKLAGRDNATEGSFRAQRFLVKRLSKIGEPLGSGADPYLQPFLRDGDAGANLLAVIRGAELPEEYVMIGAHYDHLGVGECGPGPDPGDVICNGATDNAAGTAAVLAVGKAIAKLRPPPRRSVVLALWDAEEDGLEGSEYYVQEAPLLPLEQTVAYVNLDLLGATLLPSLASNSFAIASETGGSALRDIVDAAANAHPEVNLTPLSEVFGQGRSDYRPFALAGVPTVFFGDGSSACYHTAGDEASRVDWKKLAAQSAIAFRTAVGLTEAAAAPPFVAPLALPVYADALALRGILDLAVPADLGLFSTSDQESILQATTRVGEVVDAGAGAFDDNAALSVLLAAGVFVAHLEALPCPGW